MYIIEVIKNDDQYSTSSCSGQLLFQYNAAPPHHTQPIRQYENEKFSGQWIGTRGHIERPARLPDLSPLDYFLWIHLKTKIYKTLLTSINKLWQRITAKRPQISPKVFLSVRRRVHNLFQFIEAGGGQFDHLLRWINIQHAKTNFFYVRFRKKELNLESTFLSRSCPGFEWNLTNTVSLVTIFNCLSNGVSLDSRFLWW